MKVKNVHHDTEWIAGRPILPLEVADIDRADLPEKTRQSFDDKLEAGRLLEVPAGNYNDNTDRDSSVGGGTL